MGRRAKYTEKHLKQVETYLNEGIPKVEAIKKAGFSDSSLYYIALERYGWKERVTIGKDKDDKVSFL